MKKKIKQKKSDSSQFLLSRITETLKYHDWAHLYKPLSETEILKHKIDMITKYLGLEFEENSSVLENDYYGNSHYLTLKQKENKK